MLGGPVLNVGHAENVIFGDNLGTVHQGAGGSKPAPGNIQELIALLDPITDASYTRNRKMSPPDSECFPGTRKSVIKGISRWADSPVLFNRRRPHVYWTHGYVGCGKSSISQAVSEKYGRKGRLPASFFFYRNSGDRSKMTKFAVTLSSQMVAAIPATAPFVEAAVKAERALLTREVSLATQMERLVYNPFRAVVKRGLIFKTLFKGPFLIVIDGLDECEEKEEVKEFVEHMLAFFKRYPSTPLRFFITSRVELHIQECLKTDGVRMDDLVAHGSDDDILTFMEGSFLRQARKDPVLAAYIQSRGQWPTRSDMKMLVGHIGGSFIFASALFKYIIGPSQDGSTPMERLPHTLKMNPGLDGLYTDTLARSQNLPHFSNVISTIALLFDHLSITAIAELLGIQTFEVLHTLVNLQAIIHIPGTDELPVTFCHTSLRDFLTDSSRSGCFFAPSSHHLYLSYRCFILRRKRRSESDAALYSKGYYQRHFDLSSTFIPTARMPRPVFPEVFDALYAQELAKSRNLPHFSHIISTIALSQEPLPIAGIADLFGIKASEVAHVLSNLKLIISSSNSKGALVTVCHSSLRDFLKTEERSGHFFASPSRHLMLSYRCFTFALEGMLGIGKPLVAVGDVSGMCRWHCHELLRKVPEQTILDDVGQLIHPPPPALPYSHFFTFTFLLFWILDGLDRLPRPQQVLHLIIKCMESLALTLENDPAPDRWLRRSFSHLGFYGRLIDRIEHGALKIHQDQATALQQSVERVEVAIMAKVFGTFFAVKRTISNSEPFDLQCPSRLSKSRDINLSNYSFCQWLGKWTPLNTYALYKLFKLIATGVQRKMNLTAAGGACFYFAPKFGDFDLEGIRPKEAWLDLLPVELKASAKERRRFAICDPDEVGLKALNQL